MRILEKWDCGTKILIEISKSKVDGIAGVGNVLLRAEQFLNEQDYYRAREYFNKGLDADINNAETKLGLERIDNIFKDKQKVPFTQKLKEYDENQQKEIEQIVKEKTCFRDSWLHFWMKLK